MTILAWLAVSSLVWGAVVWGAGRLIQRPDVSGRMRQWMWRGATALLVAPWVAAPLVAAFGWGLAPSQTVADTPAVMTALPVDEFTGEVFSDMLGAPAPAMIALDLTQMLLIVLAAGWIVRFVAAQLAARSLLGIVGQSREAERGAATMALETWRRKLGLRRAPRLRIVAPAISPFSYGVFRPVICLPEGLEDRLSREALDLVVGHETLHVARGDGWRRPLERITADIFWFNPFAWLIRRELDVARELACDEGVVELSSARHAYARTLRDVAGFSAGLSSAAPAASMSLADGRSLMLRVTRTLALAKRKPARSALLAACLLGLVGAPIAVAQVMLATPAPPAPPPPPRRLQRPAAPAEPAEAATEAEEALASPAAEAAEAPEPPAVEQQVYVSPDGMVRASFSAKVTSTHGSAAKGYSVDLQGTGRNGKGDACNAQLAGLGGLNVSNGQTVTRGQAIGERGHGPSLSFTVQCSDEVDGQGHLVAPIAPVAPVPPVEGVAPVAPPAPPSPLAAPAPLAPLAAPKPYPALTPLSAPTPLTPVTPLTPLTPLTPPTPATPPSLDGQYLAPPPAPLPPATPKALKTPISSGQQTPVRPGQSISVIPLGSEMVLYRGQSPRDACDFTGSFGDSGGRPRAVHGQVRCTGGVAVQPSPAPQVGGASSYSLLNAPYPVIEAGRVTSEFGMRINPITNVSQFHTGVDLGAHLGAPVRAPAGTVLRAEFVRDYGNVVDVKVAEGYVLRFGQLDEIKVAAGDTVASGAVIGTMGSSGPSTGPHLHLEVLVDGKPVDPALVRGLTLTGPG